MRRLFVVVVTLVAMCLLPNTRWVLAQIEIARTTPLECGQILESETSPNEQVQDYVIQAGAGTVLFGRVEPIGTTFNVTFLLADSGGSVFARINSQRAGLAEDFQDNFVIGSSNPILRVGGADPNYQSEYINDRGDRYYGAYTIYLGCILRDGTVIQPGQRPPDTTVAQTQINVTDSSFYGFPGLSKVDFEGGIELPLQSSQPQTIPLGQDVALYTYTASANSSAQLKLSRISGNISIGVTVINKDDNNILFIGGMPLSDALSVTLNFPSDSNYVIGVFRLDTPTLQETSGAIQLTIE